MAAAEKKRLEDVEAAKAAEAKRAADAEAARLAEAAKAAETKAAEPAAPAVPARRRVSPDEIIARAYERAHKKARCRKDGGAQKPVSYTHLTLPTNREV